MARNPLGSDHPMRLWADSVIPVEDPEAALRRRGPAIERVAAAIRDGAAKREHARRRLHTWSALSLAAAGVLAIGFSWHGRASGARPIAARPPMLHAIAGGARAIHDGQSIPASPSTTSDLAIGDGDDVATSDDGRARLDLPSGVAIGLDPSTRMGLRPGAGDEQIRMDVGTIHVDVPKLSPGHTFAVKTPDALVTVHGTSFTVAVMGTPAITRVKVAEGVVSVRSGSDETFVRAGGEWSTPLAAPAPAPAVLAAPPPEAHAAAEPADDRAHGAPAARPRKATGATADGPRPSAEPSGTLAEQNRQYQSAMDARRRGDEGAALRILDDFLSRYPASPLVQEARVERFRALAHSGDHAAAAKAARRYLATHRDGYAREEARQIALDPPAGGSSK